MQKNYPHHLFYHVPVLESYNFLQINESSIGSSVRRSYLGSLGSQSSLRCSLKRLFLGSPLTHTHADTVPFRILSDRVLSRLLSDRFLSSVLYGRVPFRVLGDSVFLRVLDPWILIIVFSTFLPVCLIEYVIIIYLYYIKT